MTTYWLSRSYSFAADAASAAPIKGRSGYSRERPLTCNPTYSLKTLIHIGQHKTGTTSIQHYLRDHRDALMQAGLYVPDSLLGFDNPSHFLLNVYALDEDRDSTAKTRLREFLDADFFATLDRRLAGAVARHYQQAMDAGCEEILWTNEGLYLLDSEAEYRRLKQLFALYSDEVVCICCFRDRDSYRQSYTRQLESLDLPLSDDPKSYRYLEPDSWLFDYDRKRALLEAVFDEVRILDYDAVDMVKVFMEELGYPPTEDTASLRLNKTE